MRHRMITADFAAAYDADPSPVVKALLWEIARLRSVIKRAHQVRTALGDATLPRVNPTICAALCYELDSEPAVSDSPTERQLQRAKQSVEQIKRREQ